MKEKKLDLLAEAEIRADITSIKKTLQLHEQMMTEHMGYMLRLMNIVDILMERLPDQGGESDKPEWI